MDTWTIKRLREQADAGAPVEPADVRSLLDALDASRRAATVPSEFVVRVTRSAFDPDRWVAEHPLLRSSASADDPADALTLGAIELRRVLADHSWPSSTGEASGPRRRRCDRATADALVRNVDDTDPLAVPLRWALDEVDRLTDELREATLTKALRARVEQGDPAARVTMLSAAVDRLTAANVTATTAEWGTDGFGSAADVGLALPCLAVCFRLRVDRHRLSDGSDLDGWTFTPSRRWFALDHRVEPRPMSRYVTAVVSPLAIDDAAELSLRRVAPRVRAGDSVAAIAHFRDVVREELPEVDVGRLRGPLSPAWVPLPIDAIGIFCAGTDDEALVVDDLVTIDDDRFGWPRFELAWISNDLDHEDDW